MVEEVDKFLSLHSAASLTFNLGVLCFSLHNYIWTLDIWMDNIYINVPYTTCIILCTVVLVMELSMAAMVNSMVSINFLYKQSCYISSKSGESRILFPTCD